MMQVKHVELRGTFFTDFWWEGTYSRFHGHYTAGMCLKFWKHELPWPALPLK